MKVFLDLDGVMADFDKRAMEILGTGITPRLFEGQKGEQALWDMIYSVKDFFYSLEPMPDAYELLRGVEARGFHPTILTGVPAPREHQKSSAPAADQKRRWVLKHLGPQYEVITCRSKDKVRSLETQGDVLIDDWHRYQQVWIDGGGHFVLHTSAADSLKQLDDYLRRE